MVDFPNYKAWQLAIKYLTEKDRGKGVIVHDFLMGLSIEIKKSVSYSSPETLAEDTLNGLMITGQIYYMRGEFCPENSIKLINIRNEAISKDISFDQTVRSLAINLSDNKYAHHWNTISLLLEKITGLHLPMILTHVFGNFWIGMLYWVTAKRGTNPSRISKSRDNIVNIMAKEPSSTFDKRIRDVDFNNSTAIMIGKTTKFVMTLLSEDIERITRESPVGLKNLIKSYEYRVEYNNKDKISWHLLGVAYDRLGESKEHVDCLYKVSKLCYPDAYIPELFVAGWWMIQIRMIQEYTSLRSHYLNFCNLCGAPNPSSILSCIHCTSKFNKCLICYKNIIYGQDIVFCPHCKSQFHVDHLLESLYHRSSSCLHCNVKLNVNELFKTPPTNQMWTSGNMQNKTILQAVNEKNLASGSNNVTKPSKIRPKKVKFHDVMVDEKEAKILKDIEDIIINSVYPSPISSLLVFNEIQTKKSCFQVKTGHVIGLNLYNLWLKALPEAIDDLRHLRYLSLEGNHFKTLTPSISNLSNLKYLILDWSIELRTLPEGISNLKNLRYLSMEGETNSLSFIPESIGHLINLKYLSLNGVFSVLPDSIGNLKNLKNLLLDGAFTELPESIGRLIGLQTLEIFSKKRILILPGFLENLTNLQQLGLHVELTYLPDFIWELPSLIHLDLSFNNLTTLPEAIGELDSLSELNLDFNGLSTLPESIGNLINLEELSIGEGNSLKFLPKSFWKLVNLKDLVLSFHDKVIFPEEIETLINLENLILLWDIPFTRTKTPLKSFSFPKSLNNLKNLQGLGIHARLYNLPDFIWHTLKLKSLSLSGNQLDSLPESIGNLTYLEELIIDSNELETIPDSIGMLTNLKKLCIDYNKLTTLPESIGNLINLQVLVLQDNHINSIPDTIGNLSKLQHLDLQSNNLTNLPESMGKLPELQYLYLGKNPLTSLPRSFIQLSERGCYIYRYELISTAKVHEQEDKDFVISYEKERIT